MRASARGCLAQGARAAIARVDASMDARNTNLLEMTFEQHACYKAPIRALVRPQSAPRLQRVLEGGARPMLQMAARLYQAPSGSRTQCSRPGQVHCCSELCAGVRACTMT